MAKAIEQKSGLTMGNAIFGMYGDATGTVRRQVYDGDTIIVQALGNLGVRFLGVDAPEIGLPLPGKGEHFTKLFDEKWEAFLCDPLSGEYGPFNPPLDSGLLGYLQHQVGSGVAQNQYDYARAAEDALEKEISRDMETLGQTEENFRFFLAFAHEIMDQYGRFLCFINRYQHDEDIPEPRPISYNERLLHLAMVSPYFIWPNVSPFRKGNMLDAVITPKTARDVASGDKILQRARQWVCDAREQKIGIFDAQNPLKLLPFEVRFLARRAPPTRWVIDLGKNDDTLIRPQDYFTIPNAEDRLFIPEEYVPLFVKEGWRIV